MTLSRESAERIDLLYEVAKSNGSLISLQEILPLLPEQATEEELLETIRGMPPLSSKFELSSGFLTERPTGGEAISAPEEQRSRDRARTNMFYAWRFSPLLHSRDVELVAVSGSTSYRSAARSSDLDLFCVTRSKSLWITLTKSLLSARAFRLANPGSPPICLSCVMDAEFASRMFSAERSALFARDALETVLISDNGMYGRLLRRASWMSAVYPALYAERTAGLKRATGPAGGPSVGGHVLNRLLYLTVGSYIRLKAVTLNRLLARRGATEDLFTLRLGEDHLIYESARYERMRRTYGEKGTKAVVQTA